MKILMTKNSKYTIYQVDKQYLYNIARFVVKINYLHYFENINTNLQIEQEIEHIFQEELLYSGLYKIYVAEDTAGEMIGCIRIMQWNRMDKLPMQKIFVINPLDSIENAEDTTFWHVGRFAIDSSTGISTVSLFKQLMIYAIYPIYQEVNGYMIAECDRRLLRTVNLLGIKTVALGKSVNYLGSETVPIYADKKGLSVFYQNYSGLVSCPESFEIE